MCKLNTLAPFYFISIYIILDDQMIFNGTAGMLVLASSHIIVRMISILMIIRVMIILLLRAYIYIYIDCMLYYIYCYYYCCVIEKKIHWGHHCKCNCLMLKRICG